MHGVACERYHAVEGAIRDRHGYTRWRGIARDLSHASPLCLPPIQALAHEGGCTYSLTIAIDWQMDGVLAGAGAPETAPKAPNLTRSLSGDKPWRMYEASYTQVLYLLWLYLLRRMCMCMCM